MSGSKLGAVEPKTILIIPFADGIGDFVNMQPLLAATARTYPAADISIAASNYANYLISPHNPVRIVTPSWFEKEPGPLAQRMRHFVSQKILAWLAGPALKRELGGNIDLVINTVMLWEWNMDFPRYWTPHIPPRPGAVHTLDCIADMMEEEFGIVVPHAERTPGLYIRPDSQAFANEYFDRHALNERPVVAMVAGSNMLIKQWPTANWAYLSDALYDKGYQPLFFGPPDSNITHSIVSQAKHAPMVVSTTLDNVVALMEKCRLCIGVDTGLLHIAAAVGTPWLGLFGPTNPEVTGPYNRSIGRGLVSPFPRGESCKTCWKTFKYEDDECQTLEIGNCTDFLDKKVVLENALDMLAGVKV